MLVLALAVTGTVLLTSGGSDDVAPLSIPRTRADPVPTAKPLTDSDIPKDCGVSGVTRKKLVPGAHLLDHCHWYALNKGGKDCGLCPTSSGDSERGLDVEIDMSDGLNESSPVGRTIMSLAALRRQAAPSSTPFRTVTGLGEQAMARYAPSVSQGGRCPDGSCHDRNRCRPNSRIDARSASGHTWFESRANLERVPSGACEPPGDAWRDARAVHARCRDDEEHLHGRYCRTGGFPP